MVKILVVYDSATGNTEKMAQAVAKGAQSAGKLDVILKKAQETKNEDLLSADGIIMGTPTYFGVMSASLKKVIDESVKIHKQLTGKVGGAFTSSGGVASGAETTLLSIINVMLVHGMIIQGRADEMHYGVAWAGKPDDDALKECELLGKNVASLALKLNQA
jgi:NAD(P)H dehydrogenase (quinone)